MVAATRNSPALSNGGSGNGASYAEIVNDNFVALFRYLATELTNIAGTANAITAKHDAAVVAPMASYASGRSHVFVPASSNTGGVTINIDSVGVKNIYDADGNALTAGALTAGRVALIVYVGSDYRLVSGTGGGAAAIRAPDMLVQDVKAAGTNGGAIASGSFETRVLNTAVFNNISGASLASNQVTLPPGTYFARWSAPANGIEGHVTRLRNVTDSSTAGNGSAEYTPDNDVVELTTRSFGCARFTITAAKAFEVQHRIQTNRSTGGTLALGDAANLGVDEIYTILEIWQISPVATGATVNNLALTGASTAVAPSLSDDSNRIVTSEWVNDRIAAIPASVDGYQKVAARAIVENRNWPFFPRESYIAIPEQPLPSAISFSRATTKTRRNAKGFLETVAIDAVAHEYGATDGKYWGWLLEKAATNILLYSSDLTNAAWSVGSASISADFGRGPFYTFDMDKIVESAASGSHIARQDVTLATATSYVASFYFRGAGRTRVGLSLSEIATPANNARAQFSLSGGGSVEGANVGAGGTWSGVNAEIVATPFTNMYQCILRFTTGADAACRVRIAVLDGTTNLNTSTLGAVYTGDGSSGIMVSCGQIELGDQPTSHIPTAGSTVTRAADSMKVTGLAFTFTDGLMVGFVQPFLTATSNAIASLDDNTTDERLTLLLTTASEVSLAVVDGGVGQGSITATGAIAARTRSRAAFYAEADDVRLSRDGGTVVTDNSATMPNWDRLNIGMRGNGALMSVMCVDEIHLLGRRTNNAGLQALAA